MPKVSIIVPVCNVEKYLVECMESILAQTLEDIEIICVDDGSKDLSGEILDVYAKKDTRVQVIHKSNTGYGHSMNVGIDAASGEYIGIVESDDYIAPELFESLYEAAVLHQLDIVRSDCIFWWSEMEYEYRVHVNDVNAYYDQVLTEENREIFFRFWMNTWTGIYRKDFLTKHHIRHNETPGASYQDNGFWIQTMSFAKRLMCLNQAFYYYRQDNFNASVKSKDKAMCMTEEYNFLEAILKAAGKKKELEICNYYRLCRDRGTFMRINDAIREEFCKQLQEDYRKYGDVLYRNATVQQWFVEHCAEPKKYCDAIAKGKEMVAKRIAAKDRILIYGAGRRGQRLLRTLLNAGYQGRIMGFVTSAPSEIQHIGKFNVYSMDELDVDTNRVLLIISVNQSGEAYADMKICAEQKGFTDILNSEPILDNFYLIC